MMSPGGCWISVVSTSGLEHTIASLGQSTALRTASEGALLPIYSLPPSLQRVFRRAFVRQTLGTAAQPDPCLLCCRSHCAGTLCRGGWSVWAPLLPQSKRFPVFLEAVCYRFQPFLHPSLPYNMNAHLFLHYCWNNANFVSLSSERHSEMFLWSVNCSLTSIGAVLQVLCWQEGAVRQNLQRQDFQKLWRAD